MLCPLCQRHLFPADPSEQISNSCDPDRIERIYCGHFYHFACIDHYMRTPPFSKDGKPCCASGCGKKISHKLWDSDYRKLEKGWAVAEARRREVGEVAEMLELHVWIICFMFVNTVGLRCRATSYQLTWIRRIVVVYIVCYIDCNRWNWLFVSRIISFYFVFSSKLTAAGIVRRGFISSRRQQRIHMTSKKPNSVNIVIRKSGLSAIIYTCSYWMISCLATYPNGSTLYSDTSVHLIHCLNRTIMLRFQFPRLRPFLVL